MEKSLSRSSGDGFGTNILELNLLSNLESAKYKKDHLMLIKKTVQRYKVSAIFDGLQGVTIKSYQTFCMDLALKQCIFDCILVKPNCV